MQSLLNFLWSINWFTIGSIIGILLGFIHWVFYYAKRHENDAFAELIIRIVVSFIFSWFAAILWFCCFLIEWNEDSIPRYPED